MNASEGLRRIAKAVRWVAYACAAMALAGGTIGTAVMLWQGQSEALASVGLGGAVAAFFYGCGRGFAWIIEGFAAEK